MNSIDWITLCEKLFEAGGRKTFHVNELAEITLDMGMMPSGFDQVSIAKKFSYVLSNNVKSKSASFSKVKNKKGGLRRGVYKIKPQKALQLTPVIAPKVSTNYTGKAGEYAVLSELLFRGFNASVMTVDEGIDIVASKDSRYFHIQVKTSNYVEGKPFSTTIRSKSLQQGGDVFYIIVLRQPTQIRFYNEFVIFPAQDIRRWIGQGIIKDTDNLSLRISIERQKFKLNNSFDITTHINDFDVIC